jgi:Family of unknown function (DUF5331)
VNIEQLRHSLKVKWLHYYQQNRSWLVKLQVWGTENGRRCPKSSFILATVSILEPELTELLPLLVALNNNPDRIASALGLNFDPEEELKLISDEQLHSMTETPAQAQTSGNCDRLPDDIAAVASIETNYSETSSGDLLGQMLTYDENEFDATNVAEAGDPPLADRSLSSAAKPNYAGAILSILALISSIAFVLAGVTG